MMRSDIVLAVLGILFSGLPFYFICLVYYYYYYYCYY